MRPPLSRSPTRTCAGSPSRSST
ncbi:hypothetical protein R2601_03968 [Salipiger bermudensis HTCC2601]|uniref:Uncharacterized protein n=1 Tax=Salipiger bermudensis (strain DSM 26914 / JCM 13377 / KCTC 12554 / HTCC2601) TaxID=314265 RepID=Q0FW52_SALBH|nr:hypothetical protein R2601_03968 [Salipiger bermudensis HTCC2601]